MKVSEKTNVMRLLDQKGITYTEHYFTPGSGFSGRDFALHIGEDPDKVFKTLVTVGASGAHYVFVIPIGEELSLKKAAKTAGEKNIQMIKQKELLPLTGYIHGGCSPIGMKKFFPTFIDETCLLLDTMLFSGGRLGTQVEVAPDDLHKIIEFGTADLCE